MSDIDLQDSLKRWRNRLSAFINGVFSKRDYNKLFGYPPIVTTLDCYLMYKRTGLARRIVHAYPDATWTEYPQLVDSEQSDVSGEKSDFTQSFEDLCEATNLLHYLNRVDRMAGIGQFAVLFIGADGDPSSPLQASSRINYFAVFGELSVVINKWERNPDNERYGLPVEYSLQTKQIPSASNNNSSPVFKSFNAHYTRVLHVAEFLEEDEVYGSRRLEPIFDDLLDMKKVKGGAAECFWITANRGMMISVDKDSAVGRAEMLEMKQQAEDYKDDLSRVMVGTGITASSMGSDTPDPTGTLSNILDLISGATNIPKRILTGSERGELASSTDQSSWAAHVDERRKLYAGPRILRPLVEIFIMMGVLPEPKDGKFWVDWAESATLSDSEKADIAVKKSTALKNYDSAPNAKTIVAPEEFREWVDLDPESSYALEEEQESAVDPLNPADPQAMDQFAKSKQQLPLPKKVPVAV